MSRTLRVFLHLAAGMVATFALQLAVGQEVPALESGRPIRVGAQDRRGPLAAPAIFTDPLGVAYVYGSNRPDLFVRTSGTGLDTGLLLYRWIDTAEDDVPVFGPYAKVAYPFEGNIPPTGTIIQKPDKTIHGIWLVGHEVVDTVFSRDNLSFVEAGRVVIEGLPRNPDQVGILLNPDGSAEILLGVTDGTPSSPTDYSWRDPRFVPYDGRGVWRGGFPYAYLYAASVPRVLGGPVTNVRVASSTQREIQYMCEGITHVDLGPGHQRDVLVGSHYGALHLYHNTAPSGLALRPRRMAARTDGNAHRHPTIQPTPVAYPNPKTGFSDVVVGGEGALYYYRFANSFKKTGAPLFDEPRFVLQQDAELYGGTLPVPNAVDWDGDGNVDIVSGNSEGRVLFFRNAGTNERPAFLPGAPIEAGGRTIHIQPGYGQDIQGPTEARWGYTSPTVGDWNGDRLLDMVMSDSTARHTVYLNRGTKTKPRLEAEHPVYNEDLDLHGTWRTKPAIACMDGRMAYVTLDDDDHFHLYWQVDDYQVEDGGKLKLEDGSIVGAHYQAAGATGRLKFNLVDWDMDGRTDILVGAPQQGSVPDPVRGLPQSLGTPGAAVLLLRNVGEDKAPVFRFPEVMRFRGKPLYFGMHECGPAPAYFRPDKGPDLIVGEECGRFYYYSRQDLTPR